MDIRKFLKPAHLSTARSKMLTELLAVSGEYGIMGMIVREDDYDMWSRRHSTILALLYASKEFYRFVTECTNYWHWRVHWLWERQPAGNESPHGRQHKFKRRSNESLPLAEMRCRVEGQIQSARTLLTEFSDHGERFSSPSCTLREAQRSLLDEGVIKQYDQDCVRGADGEYREIQKVKIFSWAELCAKGPVDISDYLIKQRFTPFRDIHQQGKVEPYKFTVPRHSSAETAAALIGTELENLRDRISYLQAQVDRRLKCPRTALSRSEWKDAATNGRHARAAIEFSVEEIAMSLCHDRGIGERTSGRSLRGSDAVGRYCLILTCVDFDWVKHLYQQCTPAKKRQIVTCMVTCMVKAEHWRYGTPATLKHWTMSKGAKDRHAWFLTETEKSEQIAFHLAHLCANDGYRLLHNCQLNMDKFRQGMARSFFSTLFHHDRDSAANEDSDDSDDGAAGWQHRVVQLVSGISGDVWRDLTINAMPQMDSYCDSCEHWTVQLLARLTPAKAVEFISAFRDPAKYLMASTAQVQQMISYIQQLLVIREDRKHTRLFAKRHQQFAVAAEMLRHIRTKTFTSADGSTSSTTSGAAMVQRIARFHCKESMKLCAHAVAQIDKKDLFGLREEALTDTCPACQKLLLPESAFDQTPSKHNKDCCIKYCTPQKCGLGRAHVEARKRYQDELGDVDATYSYRELKAPHLVTGYGHRPHGQEQEGGWVRESGAWIWHPRS